MNNNSDLLVLIGPTASGKSALALAAARACDGEIISADSMQLYRNLSIGTAKPTVEEQKEIPHHLIDCLDFDRRMDVYEFVKAADEAIFAIRKRNKRPILAGGTGMYVKAVLYGLDPLPGSVRLRKELDALYDSDEGFEPLKRRMETADPMALERWAKHRRKLIRALEVKLLTGKSILQLQSMHRPELRYPVQCFRLEWEREELKQRIFERTNAMLNAGWLEEARQVLAGGLLQSPTAHQALGYRLIAGYFSGMYSREELAERIANATWQLARRQITWFKHQHPEAISLAMPIAESDFLALLRQTRDK